MARQEIIPIRVTRAERAALRSAAGGRPVSTWLRELGLEEARRRSSALTVARLLEEARATGPGLAVVKEDPDDDLFLSTALAGGASVVVSGDGRHLLPLAEFAGVRIVDPATFLVEIDPLASRARDHLAAHGSAAPAPAAPALHDPASGRIDARRLARYLDVALAALARAAGKKYQAVFRCPASVPLQPRLVPIHRTVVSLEPVLGGRAAVLAWLNGPNGAFGGRTPLSLVVGGEAATVAGLVEETVAGRRFAPGCVAG